MRDGRAEFADHRQPLRLLEPLPRVLQLFFVARDQLAVLELFREKRAFQQRAQPVAGGREEERGDRGERQHHHHLARVEMHAGQSTDQRNDDHHGAAHKRQVNHIDRAPGKEFGQVEHSVFLEGVKHEFGADDHGQVDVGRGITAGREREERLDNQERKRQGDRQDLKPDLVAHPGGFFFLKRGPQPEQKGREQEQEIGAAGRQPDGERAAVA